MTNSPEVMVLHVFNPGHDEALAAHTAGYTDTRAARLLAARLAFLPRLWAAEGDIVVPFSALGAGADVCWAQVERIEPWGWDAALVHRLQRAGAPERLLPSAETLLAVRRLSSRKTAVGLLGSLPHDPRCQNRWCETMAEVSRAASQFGGAMLKAPWSCSGRGVMRVGAVLSEREVRRAEGWLRRQGGVEAEPFYCCAENAALEFESDGCGSVRYAGLSVFQTSSDGRYLSNRLSRDLVGCTSFRGFNLAAVVSSAEKWLSQAVGSIYRGPLGIDMMCVRDPLRGDEFLHPCIELNLRRTMGWVALRLSQRLAAGEQGEFVPTSLTFCADGGSEEEKWTSVLHLHEDAVASP